MLLCFHSQHQQDIVAEVASQMSFSEKANPISADDHAIESCVNILLNAIALLVS